MTPLKAQILAFGSDGLLDLNREETMKRLLGKVAVVTGASVGLGAAIATRMAEEGAGVALLDTQEDAGADLVKQLTQRDLVARFWRCDVSREDDVRDAFSSAASHFGHLDTVVNNAGGRCPNRS